jgi:hypothetical protein
VRKVNLGNCIADLVQDPSLRKVDGPQVRAQATDVRFREGRKKKIFCVRHSGSPAYKAGARKRLSATDA